MSNKFITPETEQRTSKKTQISQDIPGKITEVIGSGKHAQAAIVWQTIKWSFIVGSIFSIALIISALILQSKTTPIDEIKTVWSIFIPVITLALGYIFGKGKE